VGDQLTLFCLQVSLSPILYWDYFHVSTLLFFPIYFLGNEMIKTCPHYNHRSTAADIRADINMLIIVSVKLLAFKSDLRYGL